MARIVARIASKPKIAAPARTEASLPLPDRRPRAFRLVYFRAFRGDTQEGSSVVFSIRPQLINPLGISFVNFVCHCGECSQTAPKFNVRRETGDSSSNARENAPHTTRVSGRSNDGSRRIQTFASRASPRLPSSPRQPYDRRRSSCRCDRLRGGSAQKPSCRDFPVAVVGTLRRLRHAEKGSATEWPHTAFRVGAPLSL